MWNWTLHIPIICHRHHLSAGLLNAFCMQPASKKLQFCVWWRPFGPTSPQGFQPQLEPPFLFQHHKSCTAPGHTQVIQLVCNALGCLDQSMATLPLDGAGGGGGGFLLGSSSQARAGSLPFVLGRAGSIPFVKGRAGNTPFVKGRASRFLFVKGTWSLRLPFVKKHLLGPFGWSKGFGCRACGLFLFHILFLLSCTGPKLLFLSPHYISPLVKDIPLSRWLLWSISSCILLLWLWFAEFRSFPWGQKPSFSCVFAICFPVWHKVFLEHILVLPFKAFFAWRVLCAYCSLCHFLAFCLCCFSLGPWLQKKLPYEATGDKTKLPFCQGKPLGKHNPFVKSCEQKEVGFPLVKGNPSSFFLSWLN